MNMANLSDGAQSALAIAVQVAKETLHKDIQKGHILIGICSIEEALKTKYPALGDVLNRFKINLTQLGKEVRERIGWGNHVHTDNNIPSLSPVCNSVFEGARGLAGKGKISSLHLLSALLKEPDDIIKSALEGIDTDELANQVLACTRTTEGAPMEEAGEVVTLLKEFIRKVGELVKVNEELVSILKENIGEEQKRRGYRAYIHEVISVLEEIIASLAEGLKFQAAMAIVEGVFVFYYSLGVWHFIIPEEKWNEISSINKGIVCFVLSVSVPLGVHYYIKRGWWRFGVSLSVFVMAVIYAFIVTFRV